MYVAYIQFGDYVDWRSCESKEEALDFFKSEYYMDVDKTELKYKNKYEDKYCVAEIIKKKPITV